VKPKPLERGHPYIKLLCLQLRLNRFTTNLIDSKKVRLKNVTIQNCLNRFKSAQMQIDTIQTFLNQLNGMENTFLASGSFPNHPKNPYFDPQLIQNDKNHFPKFECII